MKGKGSSSILIKSLASGRGAAKRRKCNDGTAQHQEVDENEMIQSLLKEKADEVKQWAADAHAGGRARQAAQQNSKKRSFFDLQMNQFPSGHKSEADMHQYFQAPTEFLAGPGAQQNQRALPEEQPYQHPAQIDEEEFGECQLPQADAIIEEEMHSAHEPENNA